MANTSYTKKKEESDRKIQEALEARRKRTASGSGNTADKSLASKTEAHDSKMQTALNARSKRIQSSLPDIFADLQKRLTVEMDSYNQTKPTFGKYDDTYNSQRERRLNISDLRSKVGAYRSYMDEGVADSILSALDQMEKGYDAYLGMAQYDSEVAYNINEAVKNNPDFESRGATGWEKYLADQEAQQQKQKEARENESFFDKLGRWLGPAGPVDTSIPLGNAPEITHNLSKDTSYLKPNDNWSEDQKRVYGYLYDDKGTAAAQYAQLTNEGNNQTENAKKIAAIEEWATQNGWTMAASTLGAIATMPLSLADTLSALTEYNARGFVSTSAAPLPGQVSNAITGAISSTLNGVDEEGVAQNVLNENIPVIGGKGWGDVYQLGTSIANSMLSAYTQGPLGTYLVFFGSASASGMYDAKRRGATDSQAITLGILNGLAEAAGEAFSAEKLLSLAGVKELKSFFANMLLQAGIEASEEGVTTLLNTFADKWVMKDKSNYSVTVSYYMNEKGMSREEAEKQANKDWLNDIAFDMLGGAISGGVSAGLQTGVQTMFVNRAENQRAQQIYGVDPGALVSEALEIDPDNAYAQKMQGRLDIGKNLSGGQLNRLVQQNETALRAQDMQNIQSAAESRLTELGETGDVSAIAAALTKQAAGQKLTKAEQQVIAGSKYGQRVANELNTDNIKSGEYSSAWAENIGTERINAQEYSRLVEAAQLPQETAETTGDQVVTEAPKAAQAVQAEPVEAPAATVPANDQQITGKLTGKESLQVAEESTVTEEAEAKTVTLEDASKKYGAQAQAMIHTYTAGQDVAKYDAAYQAAYDMGKSGVSLDYVKDSKAASYLTDTQRELAYEAGQAASDTEAQALDAKNKAASNGKTGRRKGVVKGEGVTIADLKKTFNDPQGRAYKYLSTVAEATGIDIVLYRSEAGPDGKFQGAQGRYSRSEPGTIYIDLNAGLTDIKSADDLAKYAMLRTFAHEFTHFIEKWNPIQYNELRKVVFDTLTQRGENVNDLIEEKQAQNPGMSYDKASREVVAEAMTDILPDANFVQELAENHKTIFQKLLDQLKEFVDNLREYFNSLGMNPSREASALKEQVGETVKYLDSIVQLFDKAAVQAVENYQQTVATEEVAVAKNETTTTDTATVSKTESVAAAEETAPAVVAEMSPTETDYGFTITGNETHGSLEIKFDSKPPQFVIDVLKAGRFRWHKVKQVWYGYAERELMTAALNEAFAHSAKQEESVTKPADTVTETPEAVTKATETVTNQAESETYDPNDPYVRLAGLMGRRARFEHEGVIYRVLKAGPDNSMWQAHIDAADVSASGVYVTNARGLHYTSELYENRDDALRDIVETARASKLLDEKPTETTKPNEEVTDNGENVDNQAAVQQPELDRGGTARLLDEVEAGNVSGDGDSGNPVADTGERGQPAVRDGSEPGQRTGDVSGHGEGSSQSGDLRGTDRVSQEEQSARDYVSKKGYEIKINSLTSMKGMTQVDIYDNDGLPTSRYVMINETADWNKVKEAVDAHEEWKRQRTEKLKETVSAQVEQQSTEKPKGRNFVIGDSLDLPNGEKARYKANVEAIRLVKKLEAEGRFATEAEQVILSKYVGWGGLANAFDQRKTEWSKEFQELKNLLTDEEYASARGSTLNAHYTDISVIKAMYDGLKQLGFTGGRMMEPSSGVGNFVGAMPADMAANVRSWTMVELDGITGLIAKYLYPNADVRIQGFEKANIPNNFMDVAISNVPFGNYAIADKSYPKKVTSAIHNYFFAKSLDKVRPGGIVMFITSSYTMNSRDNTVRRYIMQKADLLGAIRLPDSAFKGNAGTEVVTDILVLKKRAENTVYSGEDFLEAPYQYVSGYNGAYINSYFTNHPEMVLGTASMEGGMYRGDNLTYKAFTDRGSLADQIREAFKNIQGKMDYPAKQSPEKVNFAVERAGKKTKNNGLVVKDGKVRVLIGSTGKMGVGMNAQKRIVAIHHLDAPWRPGDVEQRNGRAYRQGNINEEVENFTYVTEGSFDARLWDILDRKQNFINQVMNGENVGRETEDTGEVTLSAAEVKALASGSPLIMEQVQLDTDIKKLESLRRAHRSAVTNALSRLEADKGRIATLEKMIANGKVDTAARVDTYSEGKFSITIGKQKFTEKKDAGTALMAEATAKANEDGYTAIADFAGFELRVIKTHEGIKGLISGKQSYSFNTYPGNTTYMINHLVARVEEISEAVTEWERELVQTRKDMAEQEKLITQPFAKQAELDQKRARYNEVMEILNPKEEQALDTVAEDDVQYQSRGYLRYSYKNISQQEWRQIQEDRMEKYGGRFDEMPAIDYTHAHDMLYVFENMDETHFGVLERIDPAKDKTKADIVVEVFNDGPVQDIQDYRGRFTRMRNFQKLRSVYHSSVRNRGAGTGNAGLGTGAGETSDGAGVLGKSGNDNTGEADQYQQRTNTLTDREVLTLAASQVKVSDMTAAEKDALDIFQQRLSKLEALQTERAEQGRLYKEQQFGAKVDRAKAAETLNRMHVLDSQIQKASAEVLTVEEKTVLKRVLQKARTVVEQQERQHGQEILKRWRDRRNNADAIKKYRDRLRGDVDELTNWVLHPDNKNVVKHIPDALKNTVIPFLSSIDFMSKRSLAGGNHTQADKALMEQTRKLAKVMENTVDIDEMYSNYTDLPPDFMRNLRSFMDTAQEIIDSNSGDFIINQMTAEELQKLSKVVRTLKKYIMTMNRFHVNQMFKHVYEAGENSIDFLAEMEPAENTGAVSQFLLWQQMRPAYAFERFGDGGQAIYDGLRRGQATLAFNTKKITAFAEKAYTTAEVRAWEKQVKTIRLGPGKTVQMRVSQIMSLYELNKREQAKGHILGEGIRIATFKDGKQKISDVGQRLTPGELNLILQELTPRQKEVADKLQQFMQNQGGEWGNYVTVARFGEKQFGEENYFPINSDGRHLQVDADEKPGASALYALLNMSFTKQTQEKAKNRIIVYSIFDVFSNHMASMAQYNAFALPVVDALKWFNYQRVYIDEDGSKTILGSVREQMDRAFGVPEENRPGSGRRGYAQNFVINIIKALNGTEAQGTTYDSWGLQTLHNYNRAQVAYNFRVVVQQPLAITRAAQLLDYRSILKGMKLQPAAIQKNIQEMQKYSGIAAWKSLGFYDVNISRGLTSIIKHDDTAMDKITDVGMWGAEKADLMTWAAIWSASKEEVIRKQKLTPKSEGFYEAVTKLFEEVIYKTQVVDSVLTKNEFMRDKGFWARAVGSFMSESTTTASMLVDAYDKYHMDMQRGMNRQQAWKKNSKMIVRTAYVYGLGAAILAAVQAAADAFRDDDDYQEWYEKWLEAFGGNLVDELMPINKLPIVSDFYDLAKELLSILGVDTYGNPPQSVFMQWYDSLVKGVEILYDKISGEDTSYTWYGGAYKLLQAASGMVGLPMAGATREIVTAWNNIVGAMAPSLKVKTYDPGEKNEIKYAYQDGYLTSEEAIEQLLQQGVVDTENEAYFLVQGWEAGDGYSRYDAIFEAVRNGGDFNGAMRELTSHGHKEKDILSQVKSQIGEWYKDGEISKQQATNMLTKYLDMDSEEITATVNKWSSKVVTGIAFEDIKDEFLDGNITADRAVDMYVLYGGYTKEKATETVNKWRAEKETGVAYDDIKDAFMDGEISQGDAKNMYITYGGYSEEEAGEKVTVLAFVKQYPETDGISYAGVEAYQTYCEARGVPAETFYDVWKYNSNTDADVDANGKSISGSKKVKVLAYINRQKLTYAQKDSLYYAFGWAESKIYEAPWH